MTDHTPGETAPERLAADAGERLGQLLRPLSPDDQAALVQIIEYVSVRIGRRHELWADAYQLAVLDGVIDWQAAHPADALSDRQVDRLAGRACRRAKWWMMWQRFSAWLRGCEPGGSPLRSQNAWNDLYDRVSPADREFLWLQARSLAGEAPDLRERRRDWGDVRLILELVRRSAQWYRDHPGEVMTAADSVVLRAEAQQASASRQFPPGEE